MATLLEFWQLMRNRRGEAVHIFGTLESLKNTILTLQSITIAMHILNRPGQDELIIC
jgi:hypothetical protein